MPMSHDRVEFTPYVQNGTRRYNEFDATVKALQRALNISERKAEDYINDGTRIRCRPSQFGRFIIFRVEAGVQINQVKCLNAVLIRPTPDPEYVDVSKNSHDYTL